VKSDELDPFVNSDGHDINYKHKKLYKWSVEECNFWLQYPSLHAFQ